MYSEGAFFNTSDFELTNKKLGAGAYGKVCIAKNNKTNQEFAAKIINTETGFDGKEQNQFLRESLILHKLEHPSIVKFAGINFKSFTDQNVLQPTILTEYLPNGSLKENIKKESNHKLIIAGQPQKSILLFLASAMLFVICTAKEFFIVI